ncbi:MAG: radical SAM protein, partial [Planctomycetes bacterium]|nr:radical SAM protein [Planctomycetota bacterium]
PSVGCPMGCNFCSTSAMFGGKGASQTFYESGEELYEIIAALSRQTGARSFFVMDENFLLNRKRALRLLELMETHKRPWSFYVFSSANVLRKYSMDELVRLGVSWVWLGLEGKDSQYNKLRGANTLEMVREYQANGIRVLGSTIIGLEDHTLENIDAAIDYAVSHDTDFHQFMLYTPLPGTGLHKDLHGKELILDEDECGLPEIHGQARFNYRHPHIRNGEETDLLLRAFRRDFEVNGPSLMRIVRTTMQGWRKHRNHPDARVRDRFDWEAKDLPTVWAAAVSAAKAWFRGNPPIQAKMDAIQRELFEEFGLRAKLAGSLGGPYVRWKMRGEQRRVQRGATTEPPTFYESNDSNAGIKLCRFVEST